MTAWNSVRTKVIIARPGLDSVPNLIPTFEAALSSFRTLHSANRNQGALTGAGLSHEENIHSAVDPDPACDTGQAKVAF